MDKTNRVIETEIIKPQILYYGMPVILLNTLNEDGTVNISPLSSSWALGEFIVLGLGLGGKAIDNLRQFPECVINIPNPPLWENVEQLASCTGKNPVPEYKKSMGFRYQKDKYGISGLTPAQSIEVRPSRILECPIQIEAKVRHIRVPEYSPVYSIVETEVVHVHAHKTIINGKNYIDPKKWSPLIITSAIILPWETNWEKHFAQRNNISL